MTYEILRWAPVVVVLLFIAGVYLWFWLDERRFATRIDRRFAKYKTEPRPVGPRNLTWQEAEELKWKGRIADKANDLEQRVTALEERTERQANLIERLFLDKWQTATPSPATESHIKGDPLGVERDSTTLPTLRFSQSDPPIMDVGLVARVYESAEE